MNKIVQGDCLAVLPTLAPVKTIFADPPDNIGLEYSEYKDKLDPQHYYLWLIELVRLSLQRCDIFWLSYNQIHDLPLMSALATFLRTERPTWTFKKIIWMYTFGQYNDNDFGPGYRPIIRLMKYNAVGFPDAVREESERMRLGDARSTGLRVPSDCWEFPRVVGNSRERQPWHPTQHPVVLYERIMRYSGGPFVDLFAGSGTCFRAGALTGIDVTGVEIDTNYCNHLRGLYDLEYATTSPRPSESDEIIRSQ